MVVEGAVEDVFEFCVVSRYILYIIICIDMDARGIVPACGSASIWPLMNLKLCPFLASLAVTPPGFVSGVFV